MNELERIRDQIVRCLEEKAWHGPALLELLSGVEADVAKARPLPRAHTIWEIVLHLTATAELVLSRLRGEARTLSPEEDWPAPSPGGDPGAWEADRRRLDEVHRELIAALAAWASKLESRLNAPILPLYESPLEEPAAPVNLAGEVGVVTSLGGERVSAYFGWWHDSQPRPLVFYSQAIRASTDRGGANRHVR